MYYCALRHVAQCGSICKATLNCGLYAIVGNTCRMAKASSMTVDDNNENEMENVFVNNAEAHKCKTSIS